MSKQPEQTSHEESVARRHEQSDIDFGRIMIVGFGLLGLMVAGLLYSDLVAVIFSETSFAPGAPAEVLVDYDEADLPPEPRLEASPNSTLTRYLAQQDSVLHTYRWVDREGGLVQVPVDRAMELVIAKKLLESRE